MKQFGIILILIMPVMVLAQSEYLFKTYSDRGR